MTTASRARFYCQQNYWTPVKPQADNDELAKEQRLILKLFREKDPEFHVAPAGDLQAGWVVGIESYKYR